MPGAWSAGRTVKILHVSVWTYCKTSAPSCASELLRTPEATSEPVTVCEQRTECAFYRGRLSYVSACASNPMCTKHTEDIELSMAI